MRSLAILALGVALSLFCGVMRADAVAEKRVALVIGNGAYVNEHHLPNPSHDAEDVAAALKRSDFEVILGIDLGQMGMADAAIRFARASKAADVAVFYYSGHAMQFGGVNYLMPVDAKLDDEADLKRMTRVDDLLEDLQQAKNLRILVLDSCRDNPLADTLKRSIGSTRGASIQRGLNKMEAPLGTIVSFATQAGRTASDGDGRNSPYTSAFLKHIEEPTEIGDVFREISNDVYQTSEKTQLPELSLSIIGKFYLNGPVSVTVNPPAQPAPVDPCSSAEAHWKAAASIGTIAAFEDHVARFPRCAFADLAKARIAELKQKTALASPTETPAGNADTAQGFDGNWSVTIVCPTDRTALGYTFNFSAGVKGGVLHGERSTPGTPGWVVIDGPIGSDGSAMLKARGLTDVPVFSENKVKGGTPYAYTVDARFEGSRGGGRRIEVRACTLAFAKR